MSNSAAVANPLQRWHLAVILANEPGALARVVGLFSGRGYNIESLAVAEVDPNGKFSRINLVTTGNEATINQIVAQLGRLIPVRQVIVMGRGGAPYVSRELALIAITINSAASGNKAQVDKIIAQSTAVREQSTDTREVVSISASSQDIDNLIAKLHAIAELEVARTGSLGI